MEREVIILEILVSFVAPNIGLFGVSSYISRSTYANLHTYIHIYAYSESELVLHAYEAERLYYVENALNKLIVIPTYKTIETSF